MSEWLEALFAREWGEYDPRVERLLKGHTYAYDEHTQYVTICWDNGVHTQQWLPLPVWLTVFDL